MTRPNCRIGKITFKRSKSSRRLDVFNPVTNALIVEIRKRAAK